MGPKDIQKIKICEENMQSVAACRCNWICRCEKAFERYKNSRHNWAQIKRCEITVLSGNKISGKIWIKSENKTTFLTS